MIWWRFISIFKTMMHQRYLRFSSARHVDPDGMNTSLFQELPPTEFVVFKQTHSTLEQREPGMS